MSRKKRVPERTGKRPYRTPSLTVHGDLKSMTTVKGGSSSDGGGKPRTRSSGGAA